MKQDLTTGTWQDDTGCPISIILVSTSDERSRQNLRDRLLFRNDGWTKWEAVQLADELEATREMVKADWECWKKLEERFSDLDEDDQDEARRDERI